MVKPIFWPEACKVVNLSFLGQLYRTDDGLGKEGNHRACICMRRYPCLILGDDDGHEEDGHGPAPEHLPLDHLEGPELPLYTMAT